MNNFTEKQQVIIDYLNKGNYYLHVNEYIPFKKKLRNKYFL